MAIATPEEIIKYNRSIVANLEILIFNVQNHDKNCNIARTVGTAINIIGTYMCNI